MALHYVLLAIEAARKAAVEARDAELRALKAQINPHFLFNSLNSITALTSSDPGRAREMCIRLADFLRSTLGMGERDTVAWHEELNLAQTYLDVEQIRFGSRLQVEMQTAEDCRNCRVPPLLLQPLVENSIRHGIATLTEGGTIRVQSRLHDGQLRVTVENLFDRYRLRRDMDWVCAICECAWKPASALPLVWHQTEGNRFQVEMQSPFCLIAE